MHPGVHRIHSKEANRQHTLSEPHANCPEHTKDCSVLQIRYWWVQFAAQPAQLWRKTVSRALKIAVHAEPGEALHPTCRPPDWFSQLGLAEDGLEGARDCSAVGPQSVAFESGFAAVPGSVSRLSRGR
jgi:hypothetical protein